jgi:hypothetical protein
MLQHDQHWLYQHARAQDEPGLEAHPQAHPGGPQGFHRGGAFGLLYYLFMLEHDQLRSEKEVTAYDLAAGLEAHPQAHTG